MLHIFFCLQPDLVWEENVCFAWRFEGLLVSFLSLERVTGIVKGFNSDWKRALEVINQEVMRSFTNFKNGTQILQVGYIYM